VPDGLTVGDIPEFEGWVIESDRLWKIDELPDKLSLVDFASGLTSKDPQVFGLEDFDLETDVSPLVDATGNTRLDEDIVSKQAEAFIGMRTNVENWSEQNPPAPHVNLTTMTSSNPLFTDYTFHNSNVFSIRDNYMFPGKNAKGDVVPVYLSEADADYVVVGWHSQAQDDPFTAPSGSQFKKRLELRLQELFMTMNWSTDGNKAKAEKNDTDNARLLCHSAIYGVKFRRAGSQTMHVKADDAGKNFHADAKMEPLSVGTTPL
jgi:hypothetical protein